MYLRLSLLLSMLPALCSAADTSSSEISVQGSAVVYASPDQLHLTLATVTRNPNLETAAGINGERIAAALARLRAIGLREGEFETKRFTVRPIYRPTDRDAPFDRNEEISGYEVENTLSIRTTKMELASLIIDAGIAAGMNHISDFRFSIGDIAPYRTKAVEAAVRNASEEAKTVAKAACVRLGKIKNISLDRAVEPSPVAERNFLSFAKAGGGTPIASGYVEVSATASIIYKIRSCE